MTRSAGTSGFTLRRVTAEVGHRVAHDGEVHDRRDAGEVLEDDAGRHERDLGLAGRPGRHAVSVSTSASFRTMPPAGVSEDVLEQDPDGDRQARRAGPSAKRIDPIQVREARAERRPGAEGVSP
jgi:hypothetical protein